MVFLSPTHFCSVLVIPPFVYARNFAFFLIFLTQAAIAYVLLQFDVLSFTDSAITNLLYPITFSQFFLYNSFFRKSTPHPKKCKYLSIHIIYVTNILRNAYLTLISIHYPQHTELHFTWKQQQLCH